MISPETLESLILDLIQEELEILNKDKSVQNINFNLREFRIL